MALKEHVSRRTDPNDHTVGSNHTVGDNHTIGSDLADRVAHPPRSALLAPYDSSRLSTPNRIVMAPMTRFRSAEDGTPLPVVAEYYRQRAAAGLIVSEGIWPHRGGQSEWRVPGLETARHVAGWQAVTEAVHAAGGRIAGQLMHGGRIGHPAGRITGDVPAGPSSVPVPGPVHIPGGKAEPPLPRTLSLRDIRDAVGHYVAAARNAVSAGFDLVELHGANSYLIHQFLADNTNLRTDAYGGGIEGRLRFPLEVVRAVAGEIGAHRLALRLSPGNPQAGMREDDPGPLYRELVGRLEADADTRLAYLHLTDNDRYAALADLRPLWSGPLIGNVGENREPTTREQGEALLASGRADLVSYGRAFISHPDVVRRIAVGAPLDQPIDNEHLYTPTARGYTDYPALGAGR